MGRWWEYDAGPAIRVPEREQDDRPGIAFACFFLGIAALLVAIVSGLFFHAWAVSGLALAAMFGLSFLGRIVLPKS